MFKIGIKWMIKGNFLTFSSKLFLLDSSYHIAIVFEEQMMLSICPSSIHYFSGRGNTQTNVMILVHSLHSLKLKERYWCCWWSLFVWEKFYFVLNCLMEEVLSIINSAKIEMIFFPFLYFKNEIVSFQNQFLPCYNPLEPILMFLKEF